ncbi:hypothetical protein CEP54_008655 [Fusarium duplospermum]|uniref:Uncharacterized protein n=1 Tax=Fusarium duplospermum TaxID=1325734 RepID=A0A428PUT2_9HYPO|nr:hypothetical protein CEP54_008655 [Fusarium duplospermum]
MAHPPADTEKIATKEMKAEVKDAKADEAMEAEVMKRWAQSRERVERALAQGGEHVLKKYPHFEGIPVRDEPYAYAMWKMYERDGSH